MDKYFLQLFLQIFYMRTVVTSDIFQLEFSELKGLLDGDTRESIQKLEHVLSHDGAFVSISGI